MELGSFGARMSEGQKKQIQVCLKNRLEKRCTLEFNKEESVFNKDEKIHAIYGAIDFWGDNFSRGEQYKNVKEKALVQAQVFYSKKFLVKDNLAAIEWKVRAEFKSIEQYMCFKATVPIPKDELEWYNFS
jgi:GLPGLI family protein